ncbi:DUF488 domain-containing protein [Corynebacterium lubricantis]|uniref:DUF488 domain-containing protein n=1 Tax=Corynebacterium lubricantis TaxID=541095 RepID=UPI00036BF870|nr:DUF488 family protein [Corynebacterium lubricantis]
MIYAVKVHDMLAGRTEAPGTHVLVDRLWPRGIAKKDLDATWLKDVAPSPELRKWFNHDASLFDEFSTRYLSELDENSASGNEDLASLQKLVDDGDVSLLYAAKDHEINHAVVLKEWLEK